MLPFLGGLYLGGAMGANDAANVFGTAVATRILRFQTAAILCAAAAVLGATLQGESGIRTVSGLTTQTQCTLTVVAFAAAITVTGMTIFRMPISTSQAVVGAITGVGLAMNDIAWDGLGKVVICWISAPVGAFLIALIVYPLVTTFFRRVPMSILLRDRLLWGGLIVVGCYGSYALGANNVANATGIFSGRLDGITDRELAVMGGVAIAVGVLAFSRRMMLAVGQGIMPLEALTAFVAVLSMAITVHALAMIGVPVSTSQAIIGAIFGVGLLRNRQNLRWGMLRNIAVGWTLTPAVAMILSAAGYAVFAR
ncbi:MAG: inorganic phosphate transporter [Phycisphaerae bacterium]|nr:inorganic phosphate transporter [Phycisphaerae bacterium]